MTRFKTIVAVLALLAAVLIVGLTTDAGAVKTGAVEPGQIAQQVEDLFGGMSCTATVAVERPRLMVATVVCQAKTSATGG
jgi:hypothetical protein